MDAISKKNIAVEFIQEYTHLDYTKKDTKQSKTFYIITKSNPTFNYEELLFETTIYLDTDEEFRKLFDLNFNKKMRKLGYGVLDKDFNEAQKEGYFTLSTIIC